MNSSECGSIRIRIYYLYIFKFIHSYLTRFFVYHCLRCCVIIQAWHHRIESGGMNLYCFNRYILILLIIYWAHNVTVCESFRHRNSPLIRRLFFIRNQEIGREWEWVSGGGKKTNPEKLMILFFCALINLIFISRAPIKRICDTSNFQSYESNSVQTY